MGLFFDEDGEFNYFWCLIFFLVIIPNCEKIVDKVTGQGLNEAEVVAVEPVQEEAEADVASSSGNTVIDVSSGTNTVDSKPAAQGPPVSPAAAPVALPSKSWDNTGNW